jgi:hypothetical protein
MKNKSAFPIVETAQTESIETGMSLRDYFAAKAMHGLIVSYPVSLDYAKEAYKIADAMLKERDE